MQIDLSSSTDPYLFRLNGSGKNGSVNDENDDTVSEVSLNSRISKNLSAGTYTVEATTYHSSRTGNFTLTMQASGTAPIPTHTSTPTATPDIAAELDLAIEMIEKLHTAVESASSYETKLAALAQCLSDSTTAAETKPDTPTTAATITPSSSFDDIMNNYSGDIKSKIESGGVCASDSTEFFTTLQNLSNQELAKLKDDDTEYAALLSTAYGQAFEADVGNPDIIKLYVHLMSDEADSSESSEDGISAASVVSPTTVPRSGTNCLLPTESAPTEDDISGKLDVLNCIIFTQISDSGKTSQRRQLQS